MIFSSTVICAATPKGSNADGCPKTTRTISTPTWPSRSNWRDTRALVVGQCCSLELVFQAVVPTAAGRGGARVRRSEARADVEALNAKTPSRWAEAEAARPRLRVAPNRVLWHWPCFLAPSSASVRSEKKARPHLTLGIRLILIFFDSAQRLVVRRWRLIGYFPILTFFIRLSV